MSTEKTLQISTSSLKDTYSLGEQIGKNLKGGEVIELCSDIGGGKTSLVKGVVHGINSEDIVTSPTFTISRIYKSSNSEVTIAHYDFYRLEDLGIMSLEIAEAIDDQTTAVIIEWADLISNILPIDRLRIEIIVGESQNTRHFSFRAGSSHQHLLKGIVQ